MVQGSNPLLQDEPELEVFDNWEGQPGAAVMAGGKSSTRESKYALTAPLRSIFRVLAICWVSA